MAFAANMPVRQAYSNALIPSRERATVLSFDSMMNSTGGVAFQPILGSVARCIGMHGVRALQHGYREQGAHVGHAATGSAMRDSHYPLSGP